MEMVLMNCDKPEVSEVEQMRMLLLDQIPQTSRSGDNDLWAAFQHPLLFLLGHPPHHNGCLDVWNIEKAAYGDLYSINCSNQQRFPSRLFTCFF